MDFVTNVDILGLTKYTANPFTPGSGDRVIAAVNNTLVYWTGTSWSVLGSGGGGGSTWESLYAADNTFNVIDGSGFSIADASAGANAALTITKDAGSSGVGIQITQAGSGADITGTSATWSVSKAGIASLAGVSITGTTTAIATTGAAVWGILDNSATALRVGPSGGPVFLTFDSRNGAEVLSTDALTFQVTSGLTNLIQASNTLNTLVVTNNTATTFGADADSAGVAVIRSTSLTTGALLKLQLAEGTLNGGFYLVARNTTSTANNVFTIGEDGRTVITGAAGNDVFTVTAGDVVLSDSSLTLTDADNAASFTVTNDTATTASVFVVAGSGTFTGSTTSSFLTITPSGMTTGTAVYLPVAAMTTGKGLSVVANAVTTGQAVSISSSAGGTQLTGAGRLLSVVHSGTASGSGILSEFSSAAADETEILKITASGLLAAGKGLHISATAMTTGTALYITATEATLTSGKYITCFDGAAADFSVAKYGATVIAGNASGTASLTLTAGDLVVTSGNATLTDGDLTLTANASKIIFTGTGANGGVLQNLKSAAASGLSGTQLDIEILIGATPYYFTVYPTKA